MYDKDGVYDYAMMECRADGNPEPTYTWYLVERSNSQKVSLSHTVIGVNRPAIVREILHFGLFPAFQHFCEIVPHCWLYFDVTNNGENRNNFRCMETFCSKVLC